MKKDMVRESQEKDVSEMSFVERYQKDSKYKAKVQLVGYGVFLIILIVYLNIASMNSKPVENRILSNNDDVLEKDNTSKELNDWIKKLGSNYEYAIEVMIKNEEEEDYRRGRYVGKRNNHDAMMNFETDSSNEEYLRSDQLYYKRSDENYFVVSDKEVFPLLDKEYVELDGVVSFLSLAKLDHQTNYSSGKKEYVYHLLVRDFVKSYSGDEIVPFTVVIENDVITVEAVYTDLLKVRGMNVREGKVTYRYTNICKVTEIDSIEKKSEGEVNE